MPKSLNDLPDLCLLTIFQYLSLLELFRTIRLVSTRWSRLLNADLNRRRSLVIVDDRTFDLSRLQLDRHQSHLIEHVKRDDGQTPWARLQHIDQRNVLNRTNPNKNDDEFANQFPPGLVTTLVDTLPRIRSLTVVHHLSSLDKIVCMIDHWREHLVSLKIYLKSTTIHIAGRHRDDNPTQQNTRVLALFNSINRTASLKHLTLTLDFLQPNQINLPPLTILSKLSTFHSESNVFVDYLGDALVRYASSNRDLQVSTSGCSFSLDTYLGIKDKFCDKFINVQLDFRSSRIVTIHCLDQFCTRFSLLVHLFLMAPNISIIEITLSLSKLTQLVHLSIGIFTPFHYRANRPGHELVPNQINSVPSVRLLTLALYIRSHSYFEHLRLHEVFPNVQVLSISSQTEQCPYCGFNTFQMPGQYREIANRMRQCAQLARRPFRRCPRLHTIQIDANDSVLLSGGEKRLITRDEL